MVVVDVLDNYYLAITFLITGPFLFEFVSYSSRLPTPVLWHSMDPALRQTVPYRIPQSNY